VVGDVSLAGRDQEEKRAGSEDAAALHWERAWGSVGSKKEVVDKPRRRTECKYLDRGIEARGENNGGYLRSGCGCRPGEGRLTSKSKSMGAVDDSDHVKSPISDLFTAGLGKPCPPWLRIAHGGSAGGWAATAGHARLCSLPLLLSSSSWAATGSPCGRRRRRLTPLTVPTPIPTPAAITTTTTTTAAVLRQSAHDETAASATGPLSPSLRKRSRAKSAPRLHSGQMSQVAEPGIPPLTHPALAGSVRARHRAFVRPVYACRARRRELQLRVSEPVARTFHTALLARLLKRALVFSGLSNHQTNVEPYQPQHAASSRRICHARGAAAVLCAAYGFATESRENKHAVFRGFSRAPCSIRRPLISATLQVPVDEQGSLACGRSCSRPILSLTRRSCPADPTCPFRPMT